MEFLQRQYPMFSKAEQKKMREMVVLVAGAGGLGTHQIVQLQRSGVKKIYLFDYDQVELSNLNRQILYGRDDIAKPKVKQAKKELDKYKLATEIIAKKERITKASEIPQDVDIILDAFDNFTSRYILADLAAKAKLPLVHAGVSSWYGQLTTIIPQQTKSLQEIMGQQEDSKEKIAVFSPVVSIIASLQVIEAIKVYLGREDTLANKLLLVDLNDYSLEKLDLK